MVDIEDLANKSFTKSRNYIPEDIKEPLINLVKDLCSESYDNKGEVNDKLIELRRKYHINPRKCQISYMYEALSSKNIVTDSDTVRKSLKSKEMRGLSGVIVISLITSPYPEYTDKNGKIKKQRFSCKHDCHYCPREINENKEDINPRSYLSDEPTVARGLQNNFDPILQYNDRATQYYVNGHYVDKIEIIVLGGTWTEYPREYQEEFIKKTFWAANTFYDIEKREMKSLEEEQKINETSKSRIIGLTLEMRPDSITEEEIHWLRYLGCTRVQLGNQHINDDILRGVNRGCYKSDSIRALKLLKESCFKVDAHWMPDLPGSSPEEDKRMFDYIINSDDMQYDQWKVYPTATVPWTKIKKWYDEGSYIPYTEKNPEDLVNVLLDMMKSVPPWIRLNRVVRDIPNTTRDGTLYIYAGNKVTNLRQILHNRLDEKGDFCSCIRSREVKKNLDLVKYAQCVVRDYPSSGGREYFVSIESGNHPDSIFNNGNWYNKNRREAGIIYGFLRLRLSNDSGSDYFPELRNSALIRELHVYGQVASKNNTHNYDNKAQHKGFGKILMEKAEEISINNGYSKITVISGVGVRKYYERLGYKLTNTYMIKDLNRIKYMLKKNVIFSFNQLYILVFMIILSFLIKYYIYF